MYTVERPGTFSPFTLQGNISVITVPVGYDSDTIIRKSWCCLFTKTNIITASNRNGNNAYCY